MFRRFQPVVAAMLLLWATSCNAILAVSGEVAIDPPPTELRRGQTATLEFRLTNTGDEPLTLAFAGVEFIGWGPESTIIPFGTADTPPCDWAEDGTDPVPGDPPFRVGMVSFEPIPIAPGEIRVCRAALIVAMQAPDRFEKRFSFLGVRDDVVSPYYAQVVRFELVSREAEIPFLSPPSLLIFIGMLLAVALWTLRRINSPTM